MVPERPNMPDDASEPMEEYLDELIDAVRLANGSYDDLTTEDVVDVLRHRAELYETVGVHGLHPRNQDGDEEMPVLDGLFRRNEDGDLESTARRWFNVDVGFKTGMMHGREITDEEMADILLRLAAYIDKYGRKAVGSRTSKSS